MPNRDTKMNPAVVRRIVSVVPERSVRLHTGTRFTPPGAHSGADTRLVHLGQLLDWLTPLNGISKDDQRELGVLNSQGRLPRQDDDEEGEAGESGELGGLAQAPASTADRFG